MPVQEPTRQRSGFGIHWMQVASLFCGPGFAFNESSIQTFHHALAFRPIFNRETAAGA